MLNFREWFYFNESIEANIDIWISGVIDPKKPDGTPIPLPPNEAELNNFRVTNQQKQLMVDNLNKFDLNNPVDSGKRKLKITANHVKFLLGFIKSKPQALTEDYERALDALFWALSSNKVTKQQFGVESYNIGKNIQRYIEEKDREEGPSKREEKRDKKQGKAYDIDPLYQEGNIKCYYLPKIKYNLSEDEKKKAISERHKLLCKYGKNTGWCTASPSGTYHEIYKYDEIYIIHNNNIPIYQFVHCTKAVESEHCQFMDINDKMPHQDGFIKMRLNVYKFIKKYFPEVFEFYRLEKFGTDDIGKMVMDLENNPENEDSVLLQKLEEKEGDFSHIAQFYVDKNLPIPDIFQEFILRNYKNILTDHDWRKFVNFIVDNINNPLSQKILNSELDDVNIQHLLKNSNNLEKMVTLLGSENINKLTADGVSYLLGRAKNLREMATFLGTKNINKLTADGVSYLLKNSKNIEEMLTLLGSENINKLNADGVSYLLGRAKNLREMATFLGTKNINKLDNVNIQYLLKNSKNIEEMLTLLGSENINKLNADGVSYLLKNSKNIEEMATLLGSENMNKLTAADVAYYLLGKEKNLEELEKMATLLGTKNINKLSSKYIAKILGGSENMQEIANILGLDNINKLTNDDVYYLLGKAKNLEELEELATFLGTKNINKLSPKYIAMILGGSENMQEIANILGLDNINKLNREDILEVLNIRRTGLRNDSERPIIWNNITIEVLKMLGPENIRKLSSYELIDLCGRKIFNPRYPTSKETMDRYLESRKEIWKIIKPFIPDEFEEFHKEYE